VNIALESLAEDWFAWIVQLSLQIAVLAALFALAERAFLHKAAVSIRSAFTWAFLARLVLPPGLESPFALVHLLGTDTVAPSSARVFSDFALAIAVAWMLGFGAFAARAAARWRADRSEWLDGAGAAGERIEARARELARRIGLPQAPPVRVAETARGPAVVGLFRPVIVLPARVAARADSRATEHVLLHELSHVVRRDAWAALAWNVARIVFWFHPAVHWAARHAETLREIACDERAARNATDPASYRATLSDHARALAMPRPFAIAQFAPPRAQILSRLAALDRPLRASRARDTAGALFAFALLCACVVPLERRSADPATSSIDGLDGCLRTRFAVMAALAAESNARSEP